MPRRLSARQHESRASEGDDRLRDPKLDWAFARQCDRAETFDDLVDLLIVEFQRLGFEHFALYGDVAANARPSSALILHNWPLVWTRSHLGAGRNRRDPVLLRARAQAQPFLWEDAAFRASLDPDQIAMLDVAALHGLKHGVTIPLHGPRGFSACCSLVAPAPPIETARVHEAAWYALHAHEAMRRIAGPGDKRPIIRLPRRERQCLELVALGKSDDEIAKILSIEAATAHKYVEKAKGRLGAMKRTQAVAYAIYLGVIDLEKVFGV